MNNTLKGIAIVGTLSIVAFMMFSGSEKSLEITASEVRNKLFHDSFMQGCVEEGKSVNGIDSYCECSYDKIALEMGQDEFIEASKRYMNDESTEEDISTIQKAINSCTYLVEY